MKSREAQEIWKDIKGYEGLYQVSNLGRVKSFKTNKRKYEYKYMSLVIDKKGYLTVSLCGNHKRKTYKVHRLVSQAFIPNQEGKTQVNHIDGNKQNNRVDNLEWCTNGENGIHAYKNGLRPNVRTVRCITTGEKYYSTREAGRLTNTDHSDISRCCKNKKKYAGRDKNGNRLKWEYAEVGI